MNYDFAPFELAVKLKEKGYPQRTFGEYDMQGACYIEDGRFYENGCITEVARAYTAPTIPQVLKWLRNTHNLHVETYPCGLGMWKFLVTNITTLEERALCDKYTSSEQAAFAGIEYVLDNLI